MSRYFPTAEYEARWAKVQAAMGARSYDAALVWSRSGGTHERCGNLLYLANYVSTESGQEPDNRVRKASAFAALLVVPDEPPLLIADEPPQADLIATERVRWNWDTVTTAAAADMSLGAGMALGIEAFLGLDGVGSAGFEQNVIVTDGGCELLTTTPMLWWD